MVDPLDLEHFERFPHVWAAGPSSPAWATTWKFGARSNHAGKLCWRIADFAELRPMPFHKSAYSGLGNPRRTSAGSLRKMAQKQRIMRDETVLGLGCAGAPAMPANTAAMATPRTVCVCGSKKARRDEHCQPARAGCRRRSGRKEVLLGLQHGSTGVVEVEEGLQIGKLVSARTSSTEAYGSRTLFLRASANIISG